MSEEAVLLKIRRDFTQDEAVKFVLGENAKLKKQNSEILIELGIVKSERDELQYKLDHPDATPETKTKKQWSQEDMFKELNHQLELANERAKKYKKDFETFQNKYFSLLAKTSKE